MRQGQQGDIRAADYVLGLMSPAEAARFELDLRADPGLVNEVEVWRERVARLKGEAEADPTPQAQMRQRIADGFSQHFATSTPLVAAQKKPAFLIGRSEAAILGILLGAMIGATIVFLALG